MEHDQTNVDAGGWLTVNTKDLRFPPRCSDCGGQPDDYCTVLAQRFDWLTVIFSLTLLYSVESLQLRVPICKNCRKEPQFKSHWWMAIPLTLVAVGFCYYLSTIRPDFILVPIFALVGLSFGSSRAYQPPVHVKSFSARKGTVMILFERPAYRAMFLEATNVGQQKNA